MSSVKVYLITMPTFGRNNNGQKVVRIFKEFAEVLSFTKDEHAHLVDFYENECDSNYDFCHSFFKPETDISPEFTYNVYHYTFEKDEDDNMGFYLDREKHAPTKMTACKFWKNVNKKWKELKNIEHVPCKNWMQINVSSESGQCTFIHDMKLK